MRAVCGHEIGYMPARDMDDLRVADVREAVRRDPAAGELKAVLESRLDPALRDLVKISQLAARKGPNDLTLRELAERTVTRAARRGAGGSRPPGRGAWTASSPTCRPESSPQRGAARFPSGALPRLERVGGVASVRDALSPISSMLVRGCRLGFS